MKKMVFAAMLALSVPAQADSFKSTAIRCRSEASCSVAWAKALQWVAQNSQYKIRLASDHIIDTYGPHDGYHGPAFTIQRVVIDGQIGVGLTTRCWTQAGIGGLFVIECGSDEQSYLDSFIKALATDPPPPQSVGQ